MRGVFITLEGADGCGKSTQAARRAERVAATGREVVRLREPGGTSVSEKIRALVLDPANDRMAPECELLLFEASRAQLVREVMDGEIVDIKTQAAILKAARLLGI